MVFDNSDRAGMLRRLNYILYSMVIFLLVEIIVRTILSYPLFADGRVRTVCVCVCVHARSLALLFHCF